MLCVLAQSAFAQQGPKAYLIRLEGVINDAYFRATERNVNWARERGAELIILELDTPGGTIGASMELGNFLFSEEDVRIVAYINTKAYSGGTMVALACDEIYIDADLGVMGDVAPVVGTEVLGEKIQSPVRATMRRYATKRGYPVALVHAMVTEEVEAYRLRMADDPAPQYVTGAELEMMPEEELKNILGQPEIISQKGRLLTLTAQEAVEYGFARQAVTSREALYDILKVKESDVQRIYLTGSERALTLLDTFSPFLFSAGLLFLFIELTRPGFGVPGIAGLACIGAFFFVKFTLHYANMLEIVLFASGMALLVVEIFLTPGFGVVGIAGVVLVFGSAVLMFQQFTWPSTPGESAAFQGNILTAMGMLVGTAVALVLLARHVGSIPGLKRLVNLTTLASSTVASPVRADEPELADLIGSVGIALTPLHPAGRAEIRDKLLDVVTEGEFLAKGTQVEVLEARSRHVVVRAHREK